MGADVELAVRGQRLDVARNEGHAGLFLKGDGGRFPAGAAHDDFTGESGGGVGGGHDRCIGQRGDFGVDALEEERGASRGLHARAGEGE